MKLRTRLTISAVLLIVAAVSACAILTVHFTNQNTIEQITTFGKEDAAEFAGSFSKAAAGAEELTGLARQSALLSSFKGTKGAYEYTLTVNGEALSNNMGFQVEDITKNSERFYFSDPSIAARYTTAHTCGKDYFLLSFTLNVGGDQCEVSLARDITSVMDAVRALAYRCILVGALIAAVAAALMWLLVFRALRPIGKLKDSARKLADGQYENRIEINGRDELSELAGDFNAMADAVQENVDALKERNERQQTFIGDLSHELKTPVTSILINAETILNRKLPEDMAKYAVSRIYDQCRWLEQLSGKLTTLVLLGNGIDKQEESVAELFAAVKAGTEEAFGASGVELIVNAGIKAMPMDFDLMRSCLTNLVENARKASSPGQTVELTAYDNVIEVKDCGRGIPKEKLSRVTEPFYMADPSRNKKDGGSGLGLALALRIAEAHGAKLEIMSEPGNGTTVRLLFPNGK